nr:MAG TPA: hypothetical protein [Caudoviricetes sp.]
MVARQWEKLCNGRILPVRVNPAKAPCRMWDSHGSVAPLSCRTRACRQL